MPKSPKSDELTDKQEAFAVAFVQTGSGVGAYRTAYDVDDDNRAGWVYVEACKLLDNPKVTLRIKKLREAARARNEYTIDTALTELEDARQLAKTEGQAGAAVSAVTAKAKLLGIGEQPKRVYVSGPNGKPVETKTTINAKALSTAALEELEGLLNEQDPDTGEG